MRAGFWEILLIVILVLILFGHSKIPDLMKNLANGLNVFKKEIKTGDKSTEKKSEAVKTNADKKAKPAKPVAKKNVAVKRKAKKTAPNKSAGK